MSAPLLHPPAVGEDQRLGATMVLSLLVHGVLILGLGFALDDAAPVMPTLDVILTQTSSPLTPKQADFLAQASNQGGGEHDKSLRPRDTQMGRVPQLEDGVAPKPLRAQTPAPQPPPTARVISALQADT
ncbi:MAG: energy transducer TonB, partial [Luteimonas sp.]